MWPGLRTALNTERAAELGTQIAEGEEDRAHPLASAYAALAQRAQGSRTGRGRGGQGARRGDRARRLIRRSCPAGAGQCCALRDFAETGIQSTPVRASATSCGFEGFTCG